MSDEKIITDDGFSLTALQTGDKAEFARLVDAYYPVIYRLALKILGNTQDAEDILQETFIKAFRNIADFNGRSRLSTWLYRIATNEALMLIRRRKPDTISIEVPREGDEEDKEPLEIVDWCCMPERELLSSESRQRLDQAIESLPPSLRVVFVLRDIEGLSTLETGEVLHLSETAVKTRLSRARLRLRKELTQYYGDRMRRKPVAEEGGR
ncbi:MAG TPA: sigma-70 family RNA polymerase sigma factor [Anaerolineales bacterium]|nr:sigma-70 family RNA polymerase sigma factor [Anaerolineales bacterium]